MIPARTAGCGETDKEMSVIPSEGKRGRRK